MNEQLPPIDSDIREQLARRAAGRLPDGLLVRVSTALDDSGKATAGARWPRPAWSAPRLAGAGVAVALVAVVAVAIGLPAMRNVPIGPAAPTGFGTPVGYPADRALTTAELAALMSGSALPTNTPLVASVTIDERTDVCPMNRYPTIGVIEGMDSQICVMAGNLSQSLSAPAGVFAFRYLAPGYLGLLGEITPASDARLARAVGDEWPLTGETFVVEGWLGSTSLACANASPSDAAADPLNLSGAASLEEPCLLSWLSDDGSAPTRNKWGDASAGTSGPPEYSVDTLLLLGSARYVEAAQARQLDQIPRTATHGVYVVRYTSGPCPNQPVYSSVGCSYWLVLARLTEISLPAPNPSAASVSPEPSAAGTTAPPDSPAASPSEGLGNHSGIAGPGGRPLTVLEFQTLWAASADHLAGMTAIVKGPVPAGFGCQGMPSAAQTAGACRMVVLDGTIAPEGYWAVKVNTDGLLSMVGAIKTPGGAFVYKVSDMRVTPTPAAGDLIVIYGWLRQDGLAGSPGGDVDGLIALQPGTWDAVAGPQATEPLEGFFLVQHGDPATVLASLAQLQVPE